MAFVKVLKNKAYSSRYQTKFRRRRQGKTDYYARKRLVVNDKNKYDSKKYRFVVRRSNKRVVCQVIYSTIAGDRVMCAANSSELKKYGLEAGHTNYASSYCTGLLCARRLLTQLKMADMYKGVEAANGEFFDLYKNNALAERRPFKAFLDVGLIRTTTGNRSFGALKGAVDGGLYIPHNHKRFPGYTFEKAKVAAPVRGKKKQDEVQEDSNEKFDAGVHREHIMGLHVQAYMDKLKKENKEKFKRQFSKWDSCLTKNKVKNTEELYKKIHAAIRKEPVNKKAERKQKPVRKEISKEVGVKVKANNAGKKWLVFKRLTNEERKVRVQKKLADAMQKLM